jgi:hypothetical protein
MSTFNMRCARLISLTSLGAATQESHQYTIVPHAGFNPDEGTRWGVVAYVSNGGTGSDKVRLGLEGRFDERGAPTGEWFELDVPVTESGGGGKPISAVYEADGALPQRIAAVMKAVNAPTSMIGKIWIVANVPFDLRDVGDAPGVELGA